MGGLPEGSGPHPKEERPRQLISLYIRFPFGDSGSPRMATMTRAGLVEALRVAGIDVIDSRHCWVRLPLVGLPVDVSPEDLAWVLAQI